MNQGILSQKNGELYLILILGTDSTIQADGFQDSKKSADIDLEKIGAIKARVSEVAKSCKNCHEKFRTSRVAARNMF